jgi:hypothetical protein
MNERADAAGYPHLDLDAIIADGERRVRRRRVAAGAGTVAVAAAVVAAVAFGPAVLDLRGDGGPHPVSPPTGQFKQDRPTYAVGSVIHYGADALDVAPYQVRTFAQTDDGFVLTGVDGEVVFADGITVTQIGTTTDDAAHLAVDDAGSYVGWVDGSAGGAPEFVVYDTAAGEEVVRTAEGSLASPAAQQNPRKLSAMIAIDGGLAYWHDGSGVQAYDIASGTSTTVEDGADVTWLDDVESGVLARSSFDDQAVTVSPDPTAQAPNFQGSRGYLTPDASLVATVGGDQTLVFDVATGDDVTPPHPQYPYVVFDQWLDDDTVTLLGIAHPTAPSPSFDLLTCSIGQQSCEVADRGIASANQATVITPGMPIG